METMTTSIILPFLVFFPFLGAVISYIIGRSNKGARDIWCWILSAVIFIASLTLIGKETVYSLRGFCGLGLSFAADGFGVDCRADGRNLADYNHLFQGIHGG